MESIHQENLKKCDLFACEFKNKLYCRSLIVLQCIEHCKHEKLVETFEGSINLPDFVDDPFLQSAWQFQPGKLDKRLVISIHKIQFQFLQTIKTVNQLKKLCFPQHNYLNDISKGRNKTTMYFNTNLLLIKCMSSSTK
jgi:hypothetical protein